MTFKDYVFNQGDIYEKELEQRVTKEKAEWALREKELNEKYRDWEAQMNAVLVRGGKAWAANESYFLQEWKNWGREYDDETAQAKSEWEKRRNELFVNRHVFGPTPGNLMAPPIRQLFGPG